METIISAMAVPLILFLIALNIGQWRRDRKLREFQRKLRMYS